MTQIGLTLASRTATLNDKEPRGRVAISLSIVPQEEYARMILSVRVATNPTKIPTFHLLTVAYPYVKPLDNSSELCSPRVICCIICCLCCMILATAMIFISSQLSGLLAFIQLFSSSGDDDDSDASSGDDDDSDDDSRRKLISDTSDFLFSLLRKY